MINRLKILLFQQTNIKAVSGFVVGYLDGYFFALGNGKMQQVHWVENFISHISKMFFYDF